MQQHLQSQTKLRASDRTQAIQVLQGPYITNTYGNGIQCQGPTMNFTPYVTGTASAQNHNEPYYMDPVYDMRDLDEDGSLDNPGDILYHVPTRTGQKDNYSIGIGFSATWSKPLDKELQAQCKEAAAANIAMMQQLTANKRLDFEIARLKNCGNLLKEGIRFAPGTKYASICADVQVSNVNLLPQSTLSLFLPLQLPNRTIPNPLLLTTKHHRLNRTLLPSKGRNLLHHLLHCGFNHLQD